MGNLLFILSKFNGENNFNILLLMTNLTLFTIELRFSLYLIPLNDKRFFFYFFFHLYKTCVCSLSLSHHNKHPTSKKDIKKCFLTIKKIFHCLINILNPLKCVCFFQNTKYFLTS